MGKQFSRFKKLSAQERELVDAIVQRAVEGYTRAGNHAAADALSISMDVHAVHTTLGLRLGDMLQADDFNFFHDVGGIGRHLDRETGELTDHFLPRFTMPKPKPWLAAASMGGRWSPNEDRPVHATRDGKRSACGLTNLEVINDPEPVLFSSSTHRCRSCTRAITANNPEAIMAGMERAARRHAAKRNG